MTDVTLELERLVARNGTLRDCVELALLWIDHEEGWTQAQADKWSRITGDQPVLLSVIAHHLRSVLHRTIRVGELQTWIAGREAFAAKVRGFLEAETNEEALATLIQLVNELAALKRRPAFTYRGVRIEIDPTGSRRHAQGWQLCALFFCPEYADGAPDAGGPLCRGTDDLGELYDAIDERLAEGQA